MADELASEGHIARPREERVAEYNAALAGRNQGGASVETPHNKKMSRRSFLKGSAILAGGAMLAAGAGVIAGAVRLGERLGQPGAPIDPFDLEAMREGLADRINFGTRVRAGLFARARDFVSEAKQLQEGLQRSYFVVRPGSQSVASGKSSFGYAYYGGETFQMGTNHYRAEQFPGMSGLADLLSEPDYYGEFVRSNVIVFPETSDQPEALSAEQQTLNRESLVSLFNSAYKLLNDPIPSSASVFDIERAKDSHQPLNLTVTDKLDFNFAIGQPQGITITRTVDCFLDGEIPDGEFTRRAALMIKHGFSQNPDGSWSERQLATDLIFRNEAWVGDTQALGNIVGMRVSHDPGVAELLARDFYTIPIAANLDTDYG